ncbi:hypothetical protein LWI29_017871 [Acer saccharum]|uniref:Uncharacterized protein n=1 Tax=Acer saccharum TaxID=4024 RepID=A0AA39TFC9_ACESA|nr:hypothetical protein LWI29_017871 [Acer saccharum]
MLEKGESSKSAHMKTFKDKETRHLEDLKKAKIKQPQAQGKFLASPSQHPRRKIDLGESSKNGQVKMPTKGKAQSQHSRAQHPSFAQPRKHIQPVQPPQQARPQRVGHSKDGCTRGSDEQNDNVQNVAQSDNGQDDAKTDSFGPWMQFSYGMTGRNNMGQYYAGKKNGYIVNSGKDGNVKQNGSGPSRNGAENLVKFGDSRKVVGKAMDIAMSDNVLRKVLAADKSVKIGNKNVRGSRFSILSEGLEGEIDMGNIQAGSSSGGLTNSSDVLAKISNRYFHRKKQPSSASNKYLKDVVMEKNVSNKPFKENLSEKRVVGKGRACNKGKMHVEEDLENSEVL